MNELKDKYKYMVSAYYGVKTMDEYDLKEYVLKDIEDYIKNFISINKIQNFNYLQEANNIRDNINIITKLQDSLIILSKIDASLELILLIKNKIRKLKKSV